MPKHAIFLSGPIGTGKTSLGRMLAEKLGGAFIDGDDHSDASPLVLLDTADESCGLTNQSRSA